MNNNDNVSPILIKYNNRFLRLMEMIYEKDNSIYFVFPKKQGYIIENIDIKKYSKENFRIVEKNLTGIQEKYENPKISFHPRKMIVHTKSFDNKRLRSDYDIYNIAPKGQLMCYLIQIIFPLNLDMFEQYSKTKYKNVLKLNDENIVDVNNFDLKKGNLCLEIFIHSSDIYPTEGTLPISINRQLKYMTTFETNNPYAWTIAVSQLPMSDGGMDNRILININTKEENILYTMLAN